MSSYAVQTHETRTWSFAGSPEAKRVGFIVGISLLVIVPALIFGIPSNRDLSNHFRFALPFYDAIAGGHLYPGWLAESNRGYGDPSFRFYPPALYYLLGLFRFVTGEWYVATLLTFVLISVAGGLGIYLWARSILPAAEAASASLIYALAPYHLNQLYQATMLAEWAGAAVLPFLFAFLERICARGKRTDVAAFAACYALLVLTHLPLTVIGSLALLVYGLVRIESGRRVQTLAKLAGGVALGLCASSIYWVTMVSEMGWIGVNRVYYDSSVDYRYNFILSTFAPDNMNVWWMNILTLMTLLLSAPVILLLRRYVWRERPELRPVIALTAFALFMALPLSRPVWMVLSPLQETQFPWRWLTLISIAFAVLTAAALPLLIHSNTSKLRIRRLLLIGMMSISVVFTLSHVVREAKYLPQRAFEETLHTIPGTASVEAWLPISANNKPREMNVAVEAGDRAIVVNSWTPESREFTAGNGSATEARVKTFYYPHWTARSGQQLLVTRPDKDGALLVSLPAGPATIQVNFTEPLGRPVTAFASGAAFIFIAGLAMPFSWRRKR